MASNKRHAASNRLTVFMARYKEGEKPPWCFIQYYAAYNTHRKFLYPVDYSKGF